MTLVEICEPIFQFVCRLNRLARKGGKQDFGTMRAEVKALMTDVRAKAEATPGMAGVWERCELVLMYFVDSMILSSKVGSGWKPLSHERGKLGFEEEFWELVEDALKDPSEGATQLLGVMYNCIGLGFQGYYVGQPDYIKRKQLEISARLRGMIDADQAARICPDAYENVDTRNLTQPPNRSLTMLAILAVGLLAVVIVSYVSFFKHASKQLNDSLDGVRNQWKEPSK
ncbi:MAG: DotU family type IV/VI secretion system protein [Planctomycetes bacterium]|nr:DotU family type IV/VI secretion system protein [Planctomycetota bacterium]